MSESLEEVRARLRAKLAAAKANGTYVSEADQQAAWEKRVADALDPLVEALERGIRESQAGCRVCPRCEAVIDSLGRCQCVANAETARWKP